jgi:hypothetical protein
LTRRAGAVTLARMPLLPPLLSERSPPVRAVLLFVMPVVGGLATGATLGLAVWTWVVANVLATLGGVGAGLEHDELAGAARRGVLGGTLFGLSLVVADALVVDDRVAKIASPAILQVLVTANAGTLLGLAGAALRARLVRRAVAAV